MINANNGLAAPISHRLLDDYGDGSSFFFASPHTTLLTSGVYAIESSRNESDGYECLPAWSAKVLADSVDAGQSKALVVGVAPFDNTAPAYLIVPMTIWRAGPLHCDMIITPEQSMSLHTRRVRSIPTPQEYMQGVTAALERIHTGQVNKVVLSRSLELTTTTPIAVPQLLRNLARHNPQGYTFAVDLPQGSSTSTSRTLIGASPELLVSRFGMQVTANPLAGSAARSADSVEDQRHAKALLASAKDRYEHAIVVDMVRAALEPYCRTLDVPSEPTLIHTATMWHLSSRMSGVLKDPAISALTLATALHPTPAVCGFPTEQARAAIKELEPFDRGFFAGMVGWCDATGDGEWAVAIRCAEVEEHRLRLFAGAGIVLGSQAEYELAETQAKFRTMLKALGLQQVLETDEESSWNTAH